MFKQYLLRSISSSLCTGCWFLSRGTCVFLLLNCFLYILKNILIAPVTWFTGVVIIGSWQVADIRPCFLFMTNIYKNSLRTTTDFTWFLKIRMMTTSSFVCFRSARGISHHLMSVLLLMIGLVKLLVNIQTTSLHLTHLDVLVLVSVFGMHFLWLHCIYIYIYVCIDVCICI